MFTIAELSLGFALPVDFNLPSQEKEDVSCAVLSEQRCLKRKKTIDHQELVGSV
jgi:hypothetical protein